MNSQFRLVLHAPPLQLVLQSHYYTYSLAPRPPPFFCSSVFVQYNTRKRKSTKNREVLGTPIT